MKNIITKTLLALSLSVPITATQAQQDTDLGVLVMAHGGSAEWNQGILETVAPLTADFTLEVAFGMADAVSLQDAVTRLEQRGAERIAVVRLFISGESWYERTEQILGMIEGAPSREQAALADEYAHHAMSSPETTAQVDGLAAATRQVAAVDPHAGHTMPVAAQDVSEEMETTGTMVHSMEFWQIDTHAQFALSKPGLAEAEQMGEVLLERANTLSKNPAQEDVLILAHGPGDDEENARWIGFIEARAQRIRDTHAFANVKVATLREDWEDKRVAAEQEVRAFVTNANAAGRSAIVIPYRVHGFGPYATVLEGLDYVSNEQGLIPHEGVTRWIAEQVSILDADMKPLAMKP